MATRFQEVQYLLSAPLIDFGAVSAAKMGVVADFGPIPRPSRKRAMNMVYQELAKA